MGGRYQEYEGGDPTTRPVHVEGLEDEGEARLPVGHSARGLLHALEGGAQDRALDIVATCKEMSKRRDGGEVRKTGG